MTTDKKQLLNIRSANPYGSIIDTFSPEIRAEINDRLLKDEPLTAVSDWLKITHNISIQRHTLSKYRTLLVTAQQNIVTPQKDSEQDLKQLQIVANKRDLLENLIADAYKRLQGMKQMQGRKFDPQWEKYINDVTESIRKLIETMSKLNEDLDNDTEKIDNIVKRHLTKVMKAVYETIKQVCPEKSVQFQQVLQQKYAQSTQEEKKG